ncbi:MAG TPA: DUF4132 domain-containing protein, partial [Iamia sp.]|nr:DUF4132 domain-containing protein [Iamia sp.]
DVEMVVGLGADGPAAGARLLSSVTSVDQALALVDASPPAWGALTQAIYTLAAHLGPPAAPVIAVVVDSDRGALHIKDALELLAVLPSDEALDLLLAHRGRTYVAPYLAAALRRFPRRSVRRLAAAAAAGRGEKAVMAEELLAVHLRAHPHVAAAVTTDLDDAARALVDRLLAEAGASPPSADPADLPALLTAPPWTARRSRPLVVDGLEEASTPTVLAWTEAERAAAAEAEVQPAYVGPGGWAELVERRLARPSGVDVEVMALAPDDLVRPHLATATPKVSSWSGPALTRILGRFGDDAVRFVFEAGRSGPIGLAEALLPLEGSQVAVVMAGWHARSKSIRPVARRWFDRHPEAAARDLVAPAVGRPGKDRTTAEGALRALVDLGHGEAVGRAAREHGPEAAVAVGALLAVDPLDLVPTRMPSLPAWLAPDELPPVLLAGGDAVLPAAAVGHVCLMLAISRPDAPYAGVEVVRSVADAASLAGLAAALFGQWEQAGHPPKDDWALHALGLLGDDGTGRRLGGLIGAWPAQGAAKRAATAVDALAAIGTDVALVELGRIAETVRTKSVRAAARERLAEVAEARALTPDQLADRLVPHLGLDTGGLLVLDYGPRRFLVGFDEQLRPTVADEDGAPCKSLPKPGAKDDPAVAPAAHERFRRLKKEAKPVARDQIRRLDRAMVDGRRWTAADQRALFVHHPLLRHLARGLVWGTYDEGDRLTGTFGMADDGSLVDVEDRGVVLADDAVVGIVHPVHLGPEVAPWAERFGARTLLQPFPQIEREVGILTDAEQQARTLDRFFAATFPTPRALGLAARGWERGMAGDGALQVVLRRTFAGGLTVVVDLAPGIVAAAVDEHPEQMVSAVWLDDRPADENRPEGHLPFGRLDPVSASEALRDLEVLTVS